jgi:hypothetical protein
MKTPGPQNPGAKRTNWKTLRRSRYFFLAAFFLAAGFFAAFFLAAMMVYLLHRYSDPMNGSCSGGSQCIPAKRSASSHRVVASVVATTSSIALQIVVILESAHSCQWDSNDGASRAADRAVIETVATAGNTLDL